MDEPYTEASFHGFDRPLESISLRRLQSKEDKYATCPWAPFMAPGKDEPWMPSLSSDNWACPACVDDENYEPEPTDPPLATVPLPAAYAALLYKKPKVLSAYEFAVSFQGSKYDEPSMLFYSLKKDPVYFEYNGAKIVTTEGYALYTALTIPCIEDLVSNQDVDEVSWITGHSLGGAAATIYKMVGGEGDLVTFGAPPTAPMEYDPALVKYEMDFPDIEPIYGSTLPSSVISSGNPITGTRYFHKFDPVPGFYFNVLYWKHQISDAYMLYDTTGTCSYGGLETLSSPVGPLATTTTGPGVGKYDFDADEDDLDFSEKSLLASSLYEFLCTEYSVKPNAYHFTGTAAEKYFSYTNAASPVPCVEALAGQVWVFLQSLPTISTAPTGLWFPNETFEACSESYGATMSAYTMTFVSAALFSENVLYDSDTTLSEMQTLELVLYWAMWGLFWVHSTYPNYILAGDPKINMGSQTYDGYMTGDYDTPLTADDLDDPVFELAEKIKSNGIFHTFSVGDYDYDLTNYWNRK
jgi:hypothetical protein